MPEDFRKNQDRYAEENAVIFEGIDYFMIWCWLMLKRYDWLAERVVQLQKEESPVEVMARLRALTKPMLTRPIFTEPALTESV